MRWLGERGATYFVQMELPYDANSTFAANGYVGYRVEANVADHDAYGVGVYHFFRDYVVTVPNVIVAPPQLEHRFVAPLAVYLTGKGTALHVINDKGNWTGPKGGNGDVAHWCGD